MKPYYLVWCPETGYTRFKHDVREEAQKEAERLALVHKGKEFVVLSPLYSSKAIEVVTKEFDYSVIGSYSSHYDDGVPF